MNSTEFNQQLLLLIENCLDLVNSTILQITCLNNTEPSYGNAQSTCDKLTSNYISLCNQLKHMQIQDTHAYPINQKYNLNKDQNFGLFIAICAGIAFDILCEWAVFALSAKANNKAHSVMLFVANIFGMIAGVFACIAIKASLMPAHPKFSQVNPEDSSTANYLATVAGIPTFGACAIAAPLVLHVANRKLKPLILHCFNARKQPVAGLMDEAPPQLPPSSNENDPRRTVSFEI